MRLAVFILLPALLALPAPARAQADAGVDAAPDAAAETAPPPAPPAIDRNRERREALFDIAMAAMSSGRLDLAEQAFEQAAALPGDPVRAEVAASMADRVRRLRAARAAATAGAPHPEPRPHGHRVARAEQEEQEQEDAAPIKRKRDGARTWLIATSTLLGVAVYGWTVPSVLGLNARDDGRPFVGMFMMTAAAGFVVPYVATSRSEVTPAEANLAFYGATRGLWHGVLLAGLINGDVDADRTFRLWSAGLLLGSTSELVGGYLFAKGAHLTAGQARTIAVGGDFGLGLGLATGAILGLHHDEHSPDAQTRGMAGAGLVGTAAGVGLGYALARRRDNTWGDGEVMRMGGLVGAWTGLAVDVVAEWEPTTERDDKKFFLTLVAGSALGLVVGDRLVRHTDFSVSRAMGIDLAAVAGAAGTAGLLYLFGAQGNQVSGKAFFVGSAMGAAGAYGLAWWSGSRGDRGGGGGDETARAPLAASVAVLPTLGQDGQRGLSLAGRF